MEKRKFLELQIEELTEIKAQLKDEENKYRKIYFEAIEDKNEKIRKAITEKFGEVLENEKTGYSNGYFKVYRIQEGSYEKEVLSLIFRGEDYREKNFKEIQTSFYSTSGNGEFELKRMVLIGDVAKFILNESNREKLLSNINSIIDCFDEELDSKSKDENDISSKIYKIDSELRELKRELEMVVLLEDGIKIKDPEDDNNRFSYYPNLQTRVDETAFNIKELKILSTTTSGKSADVRVKQVVRIEDDGSTQYNTVEYKKVRMDNILGLISASKNKLVEQDTVAS